MKNAFADRNLNFQLVPPGVHRRNAAERAIRTFKDHFIAILCGTDANFPMHLWDKLLEQAIITLNLLRTSRINPKHSAYSQLNGPFLFTYTPIAPLGSKVMAHVKVQNRKTWDPRAEEGYYIGPAMNHYRCYNCYITRTEATRVCDTVSWEPSTHRAPTATSTDIIVQSWDDMQQAFQNPSDNAALVPYEESGVEAMQQLAAIFNPKNAGKMRVTSEMETTPQINSIEQDDAAEMRVEPMQLPPIVPEPQRPVGKPPEAFQAIPPTSSGRQRQAPAKLLQNHVTVAFSREETDDATVEYANVRTESTRRHEDDPRHYNPYEYNALHGHAINQDTGTIAEYAELSTSSNREQWIEAMTDEIGRLMKGHQKMIGGSDTMKFIKYRSIPTGWKATYCRIACADRPEKAKRYRVRLTVGGDRLSYDGNASTKTADLVNVKITFNSVISTPTARFGTIDIKDFYLNTFMRHEDRCYMRIPISLIPKAILEFYKITDDMIYKGFVYVEITKGMYGLKQAGKLANEQLIDHLSFFGYHPCVATPGLWKHATKPIFFTLVVDDFGVQYTNKDDWDHLIASLQAKYTISIDESGSKYCGMTIDWDYENHTCDISMPCYIERALTRFQHPVPTRPENAPHPWITPTYGAKIQYAPDADTTQALPKKEITKIQEVLGTLLYYARAIDSTMLTAIGSLSSEQAKGTENTMKKITHLLNYCATHPEAKIRFNRSDMILHVESDASYLSETKARSRAAGYYYFSTAPRRPGKPPSESDEAPPMNGAVNVISSILKEIVASAAEAELAALFYNAKEVVSIRNTLEEMGYPQPPTGIVTDNSTAAGIVNETVKQKRSKAMDMRFYWVRDKSNKGEIIVFWKKGSLNRADYFSKHHAPAHHTAIRPTYIYMEDKSITTSKHTANMSYMYITDTTPDNMDEEELYHAFTTIASFFGP